MKEIKKSFFHIILLPIYMLIFTGFVAADGEEDIDNYESLDSYRVLFLSSYSPAWASVPFQVNGLRASLDPLSYTIDYEFMGTKKLRYGENYKEFYEHLSYRLSQSPALDGVIVADDPALRFVQIYREELFKDIPIVFQGIEDIENAIEASKDPLITGIVEKPDYEKSLALAQSIQPNTKNIIVIHDNTETGQGALKQIQAEKDLFSGYNLQYLNSSDYERREICRFFDSLDHDYIVFLTVMGEGKDGELFSDSDIYHLIKDHIKYPVFRFAYNGLGKGIIGGYIANHEKSSFMASQMMVRILEESVIPDLVMDTPHSYFFDYNIMKKHNIHRYELPKGSIVINQPESMFDKYNSFIISGLIMSVGALIIGLYINNAAKKKLLIANLELSDAKSSLTYQNYHDDLTNLPNRRNMVEKLEGLLEKNVPHAAIIIDIDDFKEINMAYGNEFGDKVLNLISGRLLDLSKGEEIKVSRFSGDEFLVLVHESDKKIIGKILMKIREIFSEEIKINGREISLQIGMGVAIYNPDLDKGLAIVSNATLALEEAKRQGKNVIVYYDNKMREHFEDRKKVEEVLKKACQEDGFRILYQPQVDMEANIIGYEALLRLKDDSFYPSEFIPVAEDTDLILKVGRIVTKKVVEQLVDWRESKMELRPVSINFSNRQIRDRHYVDFLDHLLKEHDIDPCLIEIEITENILINNDKRARELFAEFLSIGVSLALDDFGTGYSSISYLTYIPVKKIKIDRSLVQMFINKNRGEFLGNIINLSHSLGLEITIEGVETQQEYERVKDLGADFVQGYYFSRPIEARVVLELDSPLIR